MNANVDVNLQTQKKKIWMLRSEVLKLDSVKFFAKKTKQKLEDWTDSNGNKLCNIKIMNLANFMNQTNGSS